MASLLGSRKLCGTEPESAGRNRLSVLGNEPADALRPDAVDGNWQTDGSWDPIGELGKEGRLLQNITLLPAASEMALGQDPKLFPKTRFPSIHQVRYEESDPKLMDFLSYALPFHPLCYALSKDMRGGWGGSGMRILLLRMRTNVDTFWITVTRIGFAMGTRGADFSTVFFSATLARALDLIYLKATGESLPSVMLEALSGERHIRQEEDRFERWKASQHL